LNKSPILLLASAMLACGAGIAEAGPCTGQIAEVQRYLDRTGPGPTTGPTAPQSIGAQLHHQPTPGSVENAESHARETAQAALERARAADAAGDAAACDRALDDAKLIYGLE